MNLPLYTALATAGFNLKGLKTFQGREGGGFQFTLTFNGVPVASVLDSADGGCLRIRWGCLDGSGRKVFIPDTATTPAAKQKAQKQGEASLQAKAALAVIVAAAPPTEHDGFTLSADTDMVLTELVNLAEYRKVCRTKTLIETPNGKVMSVKEPFTADLKTWILGHHPDAVIINEVLANLPL